MAEKTKEVDMYDFPVHDCIQEKKTVAHTFLSSFDNANGRLFQERLLRSRKLATMVTECLALELQRTITSNKKKKRECRLDCLYLEKSQTHAPWLRFRDWLTVL